METTFNITGSLISYIDNSTWETAPTGSNPQ